MDCLCSFLACFANTVASAIATADALPVATDFGAWTLETSGLQGGNPANSVPFQAGTWGSIGARAARTAAASHSRLLGNSQAAAIFILLVLAVFGVVMAQGRATATAQSPQTSKTASQQPFPFASSDGRRDGSDDNGDAHAH